MYGMKANIRKIENGSRVGTLWLVFNCVFLACLSFSKYLLSKAHHRFPEILCDRNVCIGDKGKGKAQPRTGHEGSEGE